MDYEAVVGWFALALAVIGFGVGVWRRDRYGVRSALDPVVFPVVLVLVVVLIAGLASSLVA